VRDDHGMIRILHSCSLKEQHLSLPWTIGIDRHLLPIERDVRQAVIEIEVAVIVNSQAFARHF
jgi:hypothetical protein